ncbi:hypothetical protein SASPL_137695 [Salvia splendens]|uniref:Uncharacterized protein n=1 Tax=Salvia splendens TaxID=180675 RepID=A0A8X8WTU2_SALSN|nr:hypothetical protein SASPL_137695 [Salvia splendens]
MIWDAIISLRIQNSDSHSVRTCYACTNTVEGYHSGGAGWPVEGYHSGGAGWRVGNTRGRRGRDGDTARRHTGGAADTAAGCGDGEKVEAER